MLYMLDTWLEPAASLGRAEVGGVIIWLASFPRSGSTLVRILLNRAYGHVSYSLYEEPSSVDGQENFTSVMGSAGQVTERDLEELRRRPEPCLVKTHGFPSDDSPALCLVRDGRDTLVSYAHFTRAYWPAMRQRYSFGEMLRILIESRDHFGGWSGNVSAWHARSSAAPTIWLRYEDLVRDPLKGLETAMRQLGMDIKPTGAPPRFDELHQRWPRFFRSGQLGAWCREMNAELQRLFWHHHHAPMSWFGYDRAPDGFGGLSAPRD